MHGPTFLTDLAITAGVAALTGAAARALKQPSILGYLFAGLVVGPSIPVPLFADPARTGALAEFGVVLVMFSVGLEFSLARLLQMLPRSGFAALVQMGFLGWAGASVAMALGWGATGAAFLGASLAISSTMVVSAIFAQQVVAPDVRAHVFGVLVVQDVVAIALMAALTALAAGQDLAPGPLLQLLARLAAVLALMGVGGMLLVPRTVRAVVRVGGDEAAAVLATGLAFGFAALAELAGFSAALGAFVAGMLVAESGRGRRVEHAVEPLRAVFAAVFFVSIGMASDPWVAVQHLPLSLLLVVVVVLGQLVSVGLASVLSGAPLRRALVSGLALGQIGELSFILAEIGSSGGVVPHHTLPVLVTVATITAFTTPWLLRRGEAWSTAVDHRLPPRVAQLLALGPVAVERLRNTVDPKLRRAVQGMAIDGGGLLLLVTVVVFVRELVEGLPPSGLALGAVVLALPLLVGLFRNARTLADAVADDVGDLLLGAAVVRATVHLLLVLAVGFPALAILRPLVRGPWAEPVLGLALGAALWAVWRRVGSADQALRSGVEGLAQRLAQRPDDEPTLDVEGFDHVVAVRIAEGDAAVGRSLADLDLRARTGALVVAILRDGHHRVLPTGPERLRAGDLLGLTGEVEATDRAIHQLREGAAGAEPLAPFTALDDPTEG